MADKRKTEGFTQQKKFFFRIQKLHFAILLVLHTMFL
jgi:hypothetical protein